MATIKTTEIMNPTAPATKKQLWALFCLTKKDYRDTKLTRKEASDLLASVKEGVTKSKTPKTKSALDRLEAELIDYFTTDICPRVVADLKNSCGCVSVVEDDPLFGARSGKKFAMVGVCSVSWITYDKRSKVAKNIEELWRKHKYTTFKDMVLKNFDAKFRRNLEKMGCPLGAVYCQDYNVNSTLMSGIVSFMRKKGVKSADSVTRID